MITLDILGDDVPAKSPVSAEDIEFKVVDTLDELEQSYNLIYKAYVTRGYVKPHHSEMRIGIYNLLPDTRTFIAKKDDLVIMTLTLIPDSPLGLPMDEIYNIEMDFLRYHGRKAAELSGLAVHETLSGKGMFIFLALVKLVYFYARSAGIDDFCIAVHPKHESFYENVLLFEHLGEEKLYSCVRNSPALGKRLNLHTFEKRLSRRNRHLYRFVCEQEHPFSQTISKNIVLDEALSCFLRKGWPMEKIRQFYHLPDKRLYC